MDELINEKLKASPDDFKETTLLRECLESHQQQKHVIEAYRSEVEELQARIAELEQLNFELQVANQSLEKQLAECSQQEKDNVTQSSQSDPAAILNRLRKEHKKSKADLKDIELIAELLGANII